MGSDGFQVAHEVARRSVGKRVALHVEYRLGEPGAGQRVADIVHVEEPVDVRVARVGYLPGAAQFHERIGTQRRKREYTARTQRTPALAQRASSSLHHCSMRLEKIMSTLPVPTGSGLRVGRDSVEATQ